MSVSEHYSQVCGVIGGMGPAATNYLLDLIVKLNIEAKKDQDHIPILVFTNPQIPDRNENLVGEGETPVKKLVQTGLVLKRAGATFLAIPCNTSHAYRNVIEKTIGMKVIDMIGITLDYIRGTYGSNITVGLLATDATIKHNIYGKAAGKLNILVPNDEDQRKVMNAIYGKQGIKASYLDKRNFSLLFSEGKKLIGHGAKVVIAGCTEIPLVLNQKKCGFPIVDPMECLAKEILRITLGSKCGEKMGVVS